MYQINGQSLIHNRFKFSFNFSI